MKGILLIIILYLTTRLFNLFILPIFTDESSYVYTAMQIKNGFFDNWDLSLNLPVVKPPLFFLLTILFENVTNNALFAGRLVSVMSGAATLTGLYVLTKKLFGKKTAIITSLLFVISPFTLTYDRLALMDSLMAAFSVWILFICLKFIEEKKYIYLLILIMLCNFSLLTKQSGKFFLLMLPVIPIFYKDARKILVFGLVSVLSYSIYYLLMSQSQYFHFYNNFDKTYINFSPEIVINNFKAVLSWTKSYFPVVFILIPISIFYILRKYYRLGLILIFWSFVPISIAAGVGQYFFPRYLLPSIVLFMPFLGFLFNKYHMLFLSVIPSLIFDYYILTDPPKAPYHFNEREQFISGWPSGYGVKEAFEKLNLLDIESKIFVEEITDISIALLNLWGRNFLWRPLGKIPKLKERQTIFYLIGRMVKLSRILRRFGVIKEILMETA
jgi:4-amino-4-deoxy-L-arabinose transferase-like glycosyltransferase